MCQKRPAFKKKIALHHSIKPFVEQTWAQRTMPFGMSPLSSAAAAAQFLGWESEGRGPVATTGKCLSTLRSPRVQSILRCKPIVHCCRARKQTGRQANSFPPRNKPSDAPPPRHAEFTHVDCRMSERQTLSESPPVFPHMGAKRVSDKAKKVQVI